jgi:23S rRNA (guanosine2251-2'-O)-methyltransferase
MAKPPKEFFVLAHNIRSLLNVGAIFRTCDSLGVTELFLSGYTATPTSNPKLAKTALGAEQYVSWEYNNSPKRIITNLKKQYPHLSVIGLENNVSGREVISLQKFKPSFPLVLVLGEEVKGIPKPLVAQCDTLVEIPMHGQKESLNVAVAFGIAAYTIKK